jgi:hypothetical protein
VQGDLFDGALAPVVRVVHDVGADVVNDGARQQLVGDGLGLSMEGGGDAFGDQEARGI